MFELAKVRKIDSDKVLAACSSSTVSDLYVVPTRGLLLPVHVNSNGVRKTPSSLTLKLALAFGLLFRLIASKPNTHF